MTDITSETRRSGRRPRRRAGLAAAVASVGVLVALAGPSAPAPAATARPSGWVGGTVSPDGLSATDGQRTLRVARSQGLDLAGQAVAVAGSGYDVSKGIYVALCVVTPPDQPPSPCGGGIDIDGVSGASAWISSNPPSYGEGLAQPYGEGGSFSVSVNVGPVVAGGFDCRQIQCAIVTRNDHVRTSDRSQDLLVPVTFARGPAPSTAPPASTAPPTSLAPPPSPTTTAPAPAPPVTLAADGLSAREGGRRLAVSKADDLDPTGQTLTVTARGFDEAKGVLVTVCRVAASPTQPPGPCLAGSTPDASAWVSSSPPEHAADLVVPFEAGGAFEVDVDVAAVIDDETDCRRVECALVVRRDDAAPSDRTLDMAIPLTFAAEAPDATTTTVVAAAAPVDPGDGDGTSPLVWVLGAVLAVGAVVGAAAIVRRRTPGRPAADGPDPDAGAPAVGSSS